MSREENGENGTTFRAFSIRHLVFSKTFQSKIYLMFKKMFLLNSQFTIVCFITLMMASAQVVETSVNTNSSPSQDYTTNADNHSSHNIVCFAVTLLSLIGVKFAAAMIILITLRGVKIPTISMIILVIFIWESPSPLPPPPGSILKLL